MARPWAQALLASVLPEPDRLAAVEALQGGVIGSGAHREEMERQALQHEQAIDAYSRALELNPRDGECYFGLGNAHDKLNAPKAAAAAFRAALAHDPNDVSAAYNLANALKSLGETDEALSLYRRALAASPTDTNMHANLAHTLDAAGRYGEAAGAFRSALALDKPRHLPKPGNLKTRNTRMQRKPAKKQTGNGTIENRNKNTGNQINRKTQDRNNNESPTRKPKTKRNI